MSEEEKAAAEYLLVEIKAGRIGASAYESFMNGVRHRVDAIGKHLENIETERRVFPSQTVEIGFKA